MTVRFIDTDPPRPYKSGKWARVTEELKTKPQSWAVVVDAADRRETAISATISLQRHGCEAVIRSIDGRHYCYARWPHPES